MKHCGDTPLGDLAMGLDSTPRNITGLVDHLERDGLVERVPDGRPSSQIQFWRNLGGIVGSALLGTMLANRLPDYLTTRVAALYLPPQVLASLPKGGSANSILDPNLLHKLPPAFASAIRYALSDTLHDIYLLAGLILIAALVSTVFMKEVPLTAAPRGAGFGEATPVEEEERAERAEVPA